MEEKIKISLKEQIKQKTKTDSKSITGMLINKKVVKGLIFFLIFALPLTFQLGNVTILDLNKQIILIFLTIICFMIWLVAQLFKGQLQFRFSILNLIMLGLLVAVFFSTFISHWQWGSFWGWPHETDTSFLTLLGFFLFYILLTNVFEKKDVLSIQLLIAFSGFLVALVGIFQLYGKFILPFPITKATSFNTIGTVNSWGIFLQAVLPVILILIFVSKEGLKKILSILGIFLLAGIILSNYWLIWVGVLFSMAGFLVFGLWKYDKTGAKLLLIPLVLFSLALILGILRVPLPNLIATPIEVSPSIRATFSTVKQMLEKSPKELLLGWGPGTFKYAWSLFKSTDLNQTIFWNLRFSKGGAQILQLFGETGILGATFYILIIIFGIGLVAKEILTLQKEKKLFEWLPILGVISGFISLSAVKFLYPSNFSLEWLWWTFLGVLGIFISKSTKKLDLGEDSKANFLISFVTILTFVGGILLFYFETTRFLSEAKYQQAFSQEQPFETVERKLLEAIKLNPSQEIFFRDLGQVYLVKANQEINRADITNEEKLTNTSRYVSNAVASSGRATGINPNNVLNWQVRGQIYRSLIGLSNGAAEWAQRCYEEALKLEPANPFIYLELARTYTAQASLNPNTPESQALLAKAEQTIREAVTLKQDYAPAFYQMALIYQAQGKRKEALTTLESLKSASPYLLGYDPMQDLGLAFQIGILYYQEKNYDKAQQELERAITLSPTYSNARYFLGLIYDEQGKNEKAIEQFTEIEKLNPDNEEVKKILTNLKAGKPALEEKQLPETLPIEEEPEEL